MTSVAAGDPRDFLASCVASTTGNPLLEQIRDQSSQVVLAVYRLVKNALVHAIDNDAVLESASQSVQILQGFSAEVGTAATLTFVDDTVFVCGQLLRATRKVYETASELASLLKRADASELSFEPGVTRGDILSFAATLVIALRDPERATALLVTQIPNVQVRKIDPIVMKRQKDGDLPDHERILKLYATGLVVMRRFHDDIAQGLTIMPHRVKRLSQRLVTLGESGDPALLGTLALANAHRDDAGRSVQSAALALAIGRQITSERVMLARLLMAALMADVGRVRLLGPVKKDELLPLPDELEPRLAPAAALVCIATGGVNAASAQRAVSVRETALIELESRLGPPYRGRLTPTLQAQIIALVRRLLALIVPRDTSRPASVFDALELLANDSGTDRALLRFLVRALGVTPTGSVVELDTGEWAVVAGPSRHPEAWSRPYLCVVTDARGRALEHSRDLDLGAPSERASARIVKVVDSERSRFNVARAFFDRDVRGQRV